MRFATIEDLEAFTEKWLDRSEIELLWKWLHNDMITEEKIVEITQKCSFEEECMKDSLRHNAWGQFFKNYNKN